MNYREAYLYVLRDLNKIPCYVGLVYPCSTYHEKFSSFYGDGKSNFKCSITPGEVYKETVWLTKRDDEKAKTILRDYLALQVMAITKKIETYYRRRVLIDQFCPPIFDVSAIKHPEDWSFLYILKSDGSMCKYLGQLIKLTDYRNGKTWMFHVYRPSNYFGKSDCANEPGTIHKGNLWLPITTNQDDLAKDIFRQHTNKQLDLLFKKLKKYQNFLSKV